MTDTVWIESWIQALLLPKHQGKENVAPFRGEDT